MNFKEILKPPHERSDYQPDEVREIVVFMRMGTPPAPQIGRVDKHGMILNLRKPQTRP